MVPSVTAPRRRATYADLLAVPEHLVAEIIDGELLTSPRPASPRVRSRAGRAPLVRRPACPYDRGLSARGRALGRGGHVRGGGDARVGAFRGGRARRVPLVARAVGDRKRRHCLAPFHAAT